MDVIFLGQRVWIPNKETPCIESPDYFSDNKLTRGETGIRTKRICETSCDEQLECLQSAMLEEKNMFSGHERIGIRGGLLPRERLELARKNRPR